VHVRPVAKLVGVLTDRSASVASQPIGRPAVHHGACRDVEPGAVALTHDRSAGQQAAGERARLATAGAEVVERVEPAVDTRNRDARLAVAR